MSIVPSYCYITSCIFTLTLILILELLNVPLDAAPVDARRSTLASTTQADANNPCFCEPFSAQCIAFIAGERGVSSASARSLIERARSLLANEETPEFAIYKRSAIAVACLASRGTLMPGPDDDCSACGIACENEHRKDMCKLYCRADVEKRNSTWKISAAMNLFISLSTVQTAKIT